ncbi:MAG TPA: flagellar biosynthesis anti-sigma factor FlgM [Steroidobacteraceae bacterium]|nr:flagellar biosynthesis anti-sigma factor FlgM [Steroidobacteraceae bacterium]
MTNKISGLNNPGLQESLPVATPGAGASGAGVVPESSPLRDSPKGDVHITDSASQLASLEQTLRSLPAVDPVRVAQLQAAIEQGGYTVQPQHVADQLLQLEQALGQLRQG